jgi:long-subunit fatty acid transport protein
MRRLVWGMTLTVLLLPVMVGLASDSPLENSAPPTPVGSGARAMGVGGAFIAIADDATAANWNPGGLVQLLKPELSVVFTNEGRRVAGDDTYYGAINHLSFVYPFAIKDINFVTALSYQRRYDFNYKNNFSTHEGRTTSSGWEVQATDPLFITNQTTIRDINQDANVLILGSLSAISPSIAIQLTPALSLGFSYNYFSDQFLGQEGYRYTRDSNTKLNETQIYDEWVDVDNSCLCNGGPCNVGDIIDNPNCLSADAGDVQPNGPPVPKTLAPASSGYHEEQRIRFYGENFNVGLLWKATPRFHVGLVYRSELNLGIARTFHGESLNKQTGIITFTDHDNFDHMRIPQSYGVGLAFRYSDTMSFMFDATRTEWNRLMVNPEHSRSFNPTNGLRPGLADVDPTMTYRVGMEYLVVQPKYAMPLRAGFFYDPEPARRVPDNYWGVAAGVGIVYEPLVLDVAYWYRWGNDVVISTIPPNNTLKTDRVREQRGDIHRQMVMLSAVLHLQ